MYSCYRREKNQFLFFMLLCFYFSAFYLVFKFLFCVYLFIYLFLSLSFKHAVKRAVFEEDIVPGTTRNEGTYFCYLYQFFLLVISFICLYLCFLFCFFVCFVSKFNCINRKR